MKKQLSNQVREKIKQNIKNRLDIAELIRDYNIKGLDLTGAIITELDVHDEDISNTNFTRAVIGKPSAKPSSEPYVNFNRAILNHCSFVRTTFPGIVWARRVKARHCNFKGAFLPYLDYKFADLSHSNFCDAVFCIGTQKSYGAVFSDDFFQDLAEWWGIRIITKSMEEVYEKGRTRET